MANALISSSSTLPTVENQVRPSRLRHKRPFVPAVIRCASLLACIALWYLASTNNWNLIVNFENVPSPAAVCQAAVQLVSSAKFQGHLLSSIARVFSGFGAAALLAIVSGLGFGRSKLLSDILMPPLELLRPIPAVAWIPLAVLMFPNPEESMIYITFVGAFYPILLNTIHGVSSVDSNLIFASLTLGANRLRVFSDVIVPAALPAMVTGRSIGMGNSWV